MNIMKVLLLVLVACRSAVPFVPEDLPAEDVECVAFTSCNADSQLLPQLTAVLVPLLTPLLPEGPKGDQGENGVSPSVQDVVTEVLAVLPPPVKGATGSAGPAGLSVSLTDVVSAVLPLLPPGPPGTNGTNGAAGSQGPPGVGLSNVSTLSAVRVYSPEVQDFKGVISVASSAVFVPRQLKVVEGSQGTGFATLEFGTSVCTYQGNNKSIDANAAYALVNCKDSGGVVLPDLVPGKPFAFTGTITLSIGVGADTSAATQCVAYLQVN